MSDQRSEGDHSLSLIVPVAAAEDRLLHLDGQGAAGAGAIREVIYVSRQPRPPGLEESATWLSIDADGRAQALNAGAAAAAGSHLWFVHADSILPAAAAGRLAEAIGCDPQALHYFDLRFHDGPALMRINEFGVRMRCALFKAPFGDQALCVPRALHDSIGGFAEDAPYGEDHLYVRAARRAGAECIRLPLAVATSARKYVRQGWLQVVCDHQVKWIRQALRDRRIGRQGR